MIQNKKRKKSGPAVIFLDAIIVVMVFAVIAVGYNLWDNMRFAKEMSYFTMDASQMAFTLENSDYARMIRGKYINEINGNTKPEQFHKLADYIEAAFDYKIYVEKNYEERAKEQKKKMEEIREDMDNMLIFADYIDDMFEKL